MKNTIISGLFFLGCVGCIWIDGNATMAQTNSSLPIVPGLSGFGVTTPAGSGRHVSPAETQIFRVTNLNASGAGSLQECIYASGARTCVFEVSGTIDLTGDKSYDGSSVINLKYPFITIAGQTAPPPGITVKGKTLRIEAHDVLIQHLRFRVGDATEVAIAPDVRDTILIAGNNNDPDRTPHNVVIDHCSISWGVDEVVSVKDSSHHITLSNNIISEGLDRSIHPKGRHSKGLMAVGNYQTIYRNLFVNLRDRAPLDFGPNSVIVNNLSHNSKYASFWPLARSGHYAKANVRRKTSVIGNVRIRGANTSDRRQNLYAKASKKLSANAKIFSYDNLCADQQQRLVSCSIENIVHLSTSSPPVANAGMNIWPAQQVKENMLAYVGARSTDRDTVDRRIIEQVISNTGSVPHCVDEKDIFYPAGKVVNASAASMSIDLGHCYEGRFDGQAIEIVGGSGVGQQRTITEHHCNIFKLNQLSLDRAWSALPDSSSSYRIVNVCTNNAGGWPRLASNRKSLDLPVGPMQLTPSGYTRLEEYLHRLAARVEGRD